MGSCGLGFARGWRWNIRSLGGLWGRSRQKRIDTEAAQLARGHDSFRPEFANARRTHRSTTERGCGNGRSRAAPLPLAFRFGRYITFRELSAFAEEELL